MERRKVAITDTILRDAHQSLIATRMRLEDMLPAAADLDAAGYFSLEVWGGATFDVCLRYLNECPWERLRALRAALPNTRLQMLLRGQNAVGYRHYADDVIDAFVERSRANGIDIFRIFDALNDIRNLKRAIRAAKQVGATVEGTISYTVSPVHTIDQFVAFARELREEGADIICIKDMAGMISPAAAFELVGSLKAQVGLPVHLHTHSASGLAPATYLSAARAGVDIVDCALSPFSWGTSQPPTESIAAMFGEGEFECGLDLAAVYRAAAHFEKVRERYLPLLNRRSERVDTGILQHQIPGGMLSNLLSQLEAQKALDKLDEVLAETARVRADLGYPPLVTPTSQIVGTQAVFNIIGQERYKLISAEVRNYFRGEYGRPPAPVNQDVAVHAVENKPVIDCRPADLLGPELPGAVAMAAPYSSALEDALSCALFPQVAVAFLKARSEGTQPPNTEPPPEQMKSASEAVAVVPEGAAGAGSRRYSLELGNRRFQAVVAGGAATPSGRHYRVELDGTSYELKLARAAGGRRPQAHAAGREAASENIIAAPMPGTIIKVLVGPGDKVEKGGVVAILEAMKMQNELKAPRAGEIKRVLVKEGARVESHGAVVELVP